MYIVIVVKSIYIRIHKILVLHNHNLCQFVLLLSHTVLFVRLSQYLNDIIWDHCAFVMVYSTKEAL